MTTTTFARVTTTIPYSNEDISKGVLLMNITYLQVSVVYKMSKVSLHIQEQPSELSTDDTHDQVNVHR